jgi:hypothetical protein
MWPKKGRLLANTIVIGMLALWLPLLAATTPDRPGIGGSFTVRSADTTPPAAITDLSLGGLTASSATLYWTAPGDDGDSGTAALYEIRYSLVPILTEADWEAAVPLAGVSPPQPAGSPESFSIIGLECGTTYHFAIRAADEVPNWSPLSNSPGCSLPHLSSPPYRIYLVVMRAYGTYEVSVQDRTGPPAPQRRALILAR